MQLSGIAISNFRNFEQSYLKFKNPCNCIFIIGKNGSGKTSLLESIYLSCNAKSFRTNQPSAFLKYEKEGLEIQARFSNCLHKLDINRIENNFDKYSNSLNATRDRLQISYSKSNKKLLFKLGDSHLIKASSLAARLPCFYFSPSILSLVEGEPNNRRSFLDWLMFHVEPTYNALVKSYKTHLKSRNSLLRILNKERTTEGLQQEVYWRNGLIKLNHEINESKHLIMEELFREFYKVKNRYFPDLPEIEIKYATGWGDSKSIAEVFKVQYERDIVLGSTQSGVHRSDFVIKTLDRRANKHLSRGQIKVTTFLLVVAGSRLIREKIKKSVLMLVDDVFAELDEDAINSVFSIIDNEPNQWIITSNNRDTVEKVIKENNNIELFHVEQGTIKSIEANNG